MRSIADVNVLLSLLVAGHPSHAAARAWFDQQPAASVGWCLLTRLGVLRQMVTFDRGFRAFPKLKLRLLKAAA